MSKLRVEAVGVPVSLYVPNFFLARKQDFGTDILCHFTNSLHKNVTTLPFTDDHPFESLNIIILSCVNELCTDECPFMTRSSQFLSFLSHFLLSFLSFYRISSYFSSFSLPFFFISPLTSLQVIRSVSKQTL